MARGEEVRWGGAFSPTFTKAGIPGEHHTLSVDVMVSQEDDLGLSVYLGVKFNHECIWPNRRHEHPPSNNITYVYEYQLQDGETRLDVERTLDGLSGQEKLQWLADAKDSGALEPLEQMELNVNASRISNLFGGRLSADEVRQDNSSNAIFLI